MLKRFISIFILLFLVTGLLTGCFWNNEVDEVEKVTFDKTEITLAVGKTVKMNVTVTPASQKDAKLTWDSTNKDVAMVMDGVVAGVSEGSTVITATSENGKYAVCLVTVVAKNIEDIPNDDVTDDNNTNDNIENEVVDPGMYDGSRVNITFWHTMGADNRGLLDSTIKRFNQMYPNIKVEHQNYVAYDELFNQIKTKMNAGKQPNIAYCYPDHVATYNRAGTVLTLDELINNTNVVESTGEMMGLTQDQLNDFIEGYYNEGKAYGDGKMYSLPFQKSTEVLYYNKTVFDRLGLEAPKTWDDVEEAIKVLKAEYPDSIPLGYDSNENMFITLAAQNHPNDPNGGYTSATGEHYIFDNDVNKAFTKKFAEWYQKGWLYTPNPATSGYTSDYFKKDDNEDGKIFMSIGPSAVARYMRPMRNDDDSYPFELGVVSLPQVDVNNPKVISQGPSICIFKDENVQEVYASWLFLKFITTDAQFQAQYSMASGYVPVIKSVGETQLYKAYLDKADGGDFITSLAAKVALEQKDAYFTPAAFEGSEDARTNVGNLIHSVFANYNLNATDAVNNAMIDEKFALYIAECKRND